MKTKKYFTLFAIIMASSTIYELPYISYNYYDILLEATGITNTQMGVLMSIFGFISMIGYFPGGYLADKFSAKKLISLSLLGIGLSGFYLATFPSYTGMLTIYILYGLLTAVTFWSAMLKGVRLLGSSDEQGRLFGLRESGTGLMPIIYGMAILAIFNSTGATLVSFRYVIIGYSVLTLIGALLAWFGIPENNTESDEKDENDTVHLRDLKTVIKMPNLWLLSIVIFSTISVYDSYSYITPYLTEFFGLSVSGAALFGLIRIYGVALVAGILSGYIADKIGSRLKLILIISILPVIFYASFLFIPPDATYLGLFVVFMLGLGMSFFMIRGVYFAAIDELEIPIRYSGTAMGFASFLGFIPEAYIYTLIGNWMDNYPGIVGYQKVFTYMICVTAVGFVASVILYRNVKKMKAGNVN